MLADLEKCCETADVADYGNFWLATATAAPVIALAAVVALPDTSDVTADSAQRTLDDWLGTPANLRAAAQAAGFAEAAVEVISGVDLTTVREKVRAEPPRALVRLRVITAVIRWIAIGNVIVQAALLALSLGVLAYNVNVIPRWVAIVLTVGGILLLAATVYLASGYNKAAKEFPKILDKVMTEEFKKLITTQDFKELMATIEIAQGTAEEQEPSGG